MKQGPSTQSHAPAPLSQEEARSRRMLADEQQFERSKLILLAAMRLQALNTNPFDMSQNTPIGMKRRSVVEQAEKRREMEVHRSQSFVEKIKDSVEKRKSIAAVTFSSISLRADDRGGKGSRQEGEEVPQPNGSSFRADDPGPSDHERSLHVNSTIVFESGRSASVEQCPATATGSLSRPRKQLSFSKLLASLWDDEKRVRLQHDRDELAARALLQRERVRALGLALQQQRRGAAQRSVQGNRVSSQQGTQAKK